MLQGAIFDFDGTLFDSMSIWDTMGARYLESLNIEPHKNVNEEFKSKSLKSAAIFFQTEYGVDRSVEDIISGINKLAEDSYLNEVVPKSGVPEFLEKMNANGVKMCVATATDKYMIEAALKRCGIEKYFETVITCSEVGHGKKNPAIYRKALELLGTDKKNSFVFEDYSVAVETAKNDGFNVIGIFDIHEQYKDKVKELADFYITDYNCVDSFWKFAGID